MMKTDGTLIVLTPGFAASEEDSTCLPMQQSLLRTLGENYPQLKIVVLSFQYPYCAKKYNWHKATVYSFNGQNKGGFQRLWLRRKIFATLKRLHRTEKIIGLFSFWYGECAAVGNLFGKRNDIRHCCWLLGQDARKGNSYPQRHFLPPDNLIALSHFIQTEFEKNYGWKPAHVIPPAVNPQHMAQTADEKDIDLVAAGSLIPLKQYDVFIRAVAEIKKEKPGVKALLIGDGPEKEKLQHLILHYSLFDNIELTGELPHEDVIKIMQRSKVFLHPSSYEGFGVVCLEALYAGAQVVSFVQPMKTMIDGWHVVKTNKEMAQLAKKLLNDNAACYKSRLPFSMNDLAQKLMSILSACNHVFAA
ncbi:glycosyltransferase [Flavisolibacter ginsenosidimutans]|uniref:Glycosyltransferase n=2 Tax=Flavisolibacter ginsenosidimutans TaxID=661481 RepID=A0A5B8UJC9_9BACT|nr:glycosyltransferase [Flavisolibacter ginsenosidimutans]